MKGIIGKGKKILREKRRSFQEVLETVKELSKEESREMIALVLRETLRFLKTCRKAKGELYIAIEDPYTMGQVLEGLALFYPLVQDKIRLVPEFGDSYYYGKIRIEGRIRLIHLLILLVHLLKNKQFRKLVLKGGKHGK